MIALRVYGEDRNWTAEVVATAQRGDDEWTPLPRPVTVRAKNARDAVVSAIRAYARAQVQPLTCERCEYAWRPTRKADPDRCPACRNPRRYSPRERARRKTRRLLEQLGAPPEAIKGPGSGTHGSRE